MNESSHEDVKKRLEVRLFEPVARRTRPCNRTAFRSLISPTTWCGKRRDSDSGRQSNFEDCEDKAQVQNLFRDRKGL
jgi:hypothetical protein